MVTKCHIICSLQHYLCSFLRYTTQQTSIMHFITASQSMQSAGYYIYRHQYSEIHVRNAMQKFCAMYEPSKMAVRVDYSECIKRCVRNLIRE